MHRAWVSARAWSPRAARDTGRHAPSAHTVDETVKCIVAHGVFLASGAYEMVGALMKLACTMGADIKSELPLAAHIADVCKSNREGEHAPTHLNKPTLATPAERLRPRPPGYGCRRGCAAFRVSARASPTHGLPPSSFRCDDRPLITRTRPHALTTVCPPLLHR